MEAGKEENITFTITNLMCPPVLKPPTQKRRGRRPKYATPEEAKEAQRLQIKLAHHRQKMRLATDPEYRELWRERARHYYHQRYPKIREQIALRNYERQVAKLQDDIKRETEYLLELMDDPDTLPPLEEAEIVPDDDVPVELNPLNVSMLRTKHDTPKTLGMGNILKNLDPAEVGWVWGRS